MALSKYKLGDLIELRDERNSDGKFTLEDVKGISTGKEFIETKANMDGVSLDSYKVVNPQEFAYVADTSRRGEKIAVAFNIEKKSVLISSIYTVFRVSRKDILLSDYLFMYFTVLNLTVMHDSILGVLHVKLLIGIQCAILTLSFPTLPHNKNMLISTKPWLQINKAMNEA